MRLVLLIIFIASFIKAEELRADESAKIDDIFVESRRRETEIKDFLVANENTKVAEIKPELKAKIDSFFKKENSVLLLMFELNDRKVNISDFRLMLLKRVYLYTKEIAIKWENINTLSFLTIIELLLATKDEELTKDILSYFERVPNPSFDLKNPGWDHFKLVGGFKGSFATVLLQSNQEVIDKHMLNYYARTKSLLTKQHMIYALYFQTKECTPIRNYQWLVKLEALTKDKTLLDLIEEKKVFHVSVAIGQITECPSVDMAQITEEKKVKILKFILRKDILKYLPKELRGP